MDFSGSFYHLLGRPEPQCAWIIWGQSGSGKTTFTCRLAKYLVGGGRQPLTATFISGCRNDGSERTGGAPGHELR